MKKQSKTSKKSKRIVVIVSVLCSLALIFPAVAAATEYLSENDPLVTLSYLKDIFGPSLKQEIKDEISAEAKTENDDDTEKNEEAEENTPSVNTGYEVVELSEGQKLTSANGTVELIVRPGSSAKVVSDISDNGLSDISEMKEVLNGEQVGINHALIIPRNDGRGIVITSDKAYVLVRGDYKID